MAGEVPEVAFDYAFVRRDDEEHVATLLVMRDRDTKAVRAWCLPNKGADIRETVDRAVAGVNSLGYRGRVLIRCDGEPALGALRDAITKAMPDGATPVVTPVGESASNGGIEQAVRTVKGLLRVHLLALEAKISGKFPSGHPVLTWLVEHVSDIVSKHMVGLDGKTGYERLYGRPSREEGLEFGELLHWRHRPTKDMNVVLDARWSCGVWLGRSWGGIVHNVFANGKVHGVRGVQRRPRADRWRKEALEAVTATPWDRAPAAEGEMRVLPPLAPPAAAQGPAPAEEVRELEYNPRRVFIKLTDLELHGFTAGCRRCNLMRNGQAALGVRHLDACRLRIEQAMRDADHPRLERAEGRQLDELERRAAARADEAAAAPATPVLEPEAPATPQAWHDEAPATPQAWHDEAPATPPRAAPAWHAIAQPDADGAFESRLDANGDFVMRVGRAKGQKRVRFETGTASASSCSDMQLLEQTRAEGRLGIQLSEQTRLPTQLSEQTFYSGRGPDARVVELLSPPRVTQALPAGTGLLAGWRAAEQLRRDNRARGIRAVRAWSSAREQHSVRGAEVHCDRAQGHTKDEDDELAAWPAKEVYDEITGAALPTELVRQARAEEVKFMLDWGVWERARVTDCWRETGKAPIGSKWVDVNKGDSKKPLIRSRFVVKEIATYKTDDFFAATPPLEALRLLLSMAASSEQDVKVEVLDARKAHLHAFADRTVFVKLPPEVDEPGWCARLVRCLYGTRDAPKRWQAFLDEQLVALGFAKGRASPCCFHHRLLDVRCIVHGDDFVLSGTAGALDEVKARMHERFLLKELGRLGGGEGELKELRVLNRIIQWTPAGLRYEADPRHAEIVVRGVAGTERALSAPGTGSKDFEAAPGEGENLPERTSSLFRSFAARANYLALDRPDISQATKELCRRMSAPKAADLRALARVARYLAGAGRVIYEYPWQSCPVLRVYTDSDFAGCIATRLSTSGGAVMLGSHLLKHWASTQKRITLSSGEAELGAVVRGFSEALGLQSVARDLGVELQPEVHADSSAAIGICRRSGIGKVRHLAVAQLWVQDLVRSREVRLHKVLGTENPADLMTKPLPRAEIDGHLARLGLSRATGRAETAPRADAEVDTTLAQQ